MLTGRCHAHLSRHGDRLTPCPPDSISRSPSHRNSGRRHRCARIYLLSYGFLYTLTCSLSYPETCIWPLVRVGICFSCLECRCFSLLQRIPIRRQFPGGRGTQGIPPVSSNTVSCPSVCIGRTGRVQAPPPPACLKASCLLYAVQQSCFDEDDRMVPSTPTLMLPHRIDSFAEAIQ